MSDNSARPQSCRRNGRCSWLVAVVVTLVPASIMACDVRSILSAPQGARAQQALGAAMEQETRLTSGFVKLRLTVTPQKDGFSCEGSFCQAKWKRLLSELGKEGTLVYRWNGDSDWFIAVEDGDGNRLRELVCDGSWIYDRDAVWDIRFLEKNEPHISEDLEIEFAGVIWPFWVAAEGHLFPLSMGRRDFTFLPTLPNIRHADFQEVSSTLEKISLSQLGGTILELELDPAHGHTMLRWGQVETKETHQIWCTWENHLEVGEELFVPTDYTVLTSNDTVLLHSSLIEEESRFLLSDLPVFEEPETDAEKVYHIWKSTSDNEP